ncbi:MAG: cysteine hydrolase [Dehalococcoidales bacterium]|nr:cysteine hydrolase [Dehalococcoidales bacterium]
MELKIDVSKSMLLMLHCQNDIVKPEGKFAVSGMPDQVAKHNLLERWASIVAAGRSAGMRVGYVNNVLRPGFPELGERPFPLMRGTKGYNAFLRGTWGAEVADEIKPQPDDLVIVNFNSSAFSYTELDLILRHAKIERLFLAGVATTFVVNSTARYGAELGYEITVLEDCCTAFSDELHDFEVANVLPHFAEIIRADDFIVALTGR